MSDQDIRWCPGCGDYSILANVQRVMPDLGVPRENVVFVSGIGCSSRFPYYMFLVRDTGAQHYFGVPLARGYEIYREAS